MRRSIISTTAAAIIAGGLVVAAAGTAEAAKDNLGMGLHFDVTAPADSPGMCQWVVTMTAGTPDAVKEYVYEESSSAIVLTGKKHDELPDPTVADGNQVTFLLPQGSTFAFAAYGVYSTGKHTVVSVLYPQTVAC
jgi:hypothetical protein